MKITWTHPKERDKRGMTLGDMQAFIGECRRAGIPMSERPKIVQNLPSRITKMEAGR